MHNRWHNQYVDSHPHFCTFTVSKWQPLLLDNTDIIYEEWMRAKDTINIRILAYTVMPDHVHMILWSDSGNKIKQFLQRTLSIIARRMSNGKGQFWKERPRVYPINSRGVLQVKINYLHMNPVRAGFVDDVSSWKHSSIHQYNLDNPDVYFMCDQWDNISFL
ncbi:MAG: transposase [Armatimonadota bacterium]